MSTCSSSTLATTSFPTLAKLCAQAIVADPTRLLSNDVLTKYEKSHFHNYNSLCKNQCQTTTKLALARLSKNIDISEFRCLFTVGSDGRDEKVSRTESPVELVVYSPKGAEPPETKLLARYVEIEKDFFPEIEEINSSMSTLYLDGKLIPTRGLHSKLLKGDKGVHREYLLALLNDIINMPAKTYKKFKNETTRSSLRMQRRCIDGLQTTAVDLERGIVSYYGESFDSRATKYNLLRPIQNTLDQIICNHLRANKEQLEDCMIFLDGLPSTTVDIIDYLESQSLLPSLLPKEIKNLKTAYTYGLMYTHIGQVIYEESRTPAEIQLGAKRTVLFHDIYQNTYDILTKLKHG